jgi:hypothetical protein
MMTIILIIVIFLMHLPLTWICPFLRGTLPRHHLTTTSVASSHVLNKLNTFKVTERFSGYKVELNDNTRRLQYSSSYRTAANRCITVHKQIHVLRNDTARGVECCRLPVMIRHLITWHDTIFGSYFLCECYLLGNIPVSTMPNCGG